MALRDFVLHILYSIFNNVIFSKMAIKTSKLLQIRTPPISLSNVALVPIVTLLRRSFISECAPFYNMHTEVHPITLLAPRPPSVGLVSCYVQSSENTTSHGLYILPRSRIKSAVALSRLENLGVNKMGDHRPLPTLIRQSESAG